MYPLNIRKFQDKDLEDLFALLSDEEVMQYLEPPYTREQASQFLHSYGMGNAPLVYAVEDQSNNFLGYVIYHPYDAVSYEIGWVLCKAAWGKGYASTLTQMLIADARGKTSRLILECAPLQTATKAIARKHHFAFLEHRDGLDVYALSLIPASD